MKKEKKSIEEEKMTKSKKKVDKMRIVTKIIAAIMAALMILGIGASFIYYILRMF